MNVKENDILLCIAWSVFAIILLIISKICCIRCNPCYDKCRGRTLTCILSSIGAAAAILSGIGSAIGIGNTTVSTLIASTINPGAVAEINVLLNIGIRAIYMPIGASIIIAVGIILCLICSCCQR